MILNLDRHKPGIMLAQNRRDEKILPKLMQVINRWISGVLITSCPPVEPPVATCRFINESI